MEETSTKNDIEIASCPDTLGENINKTAHTSKYGEDTTDESATNRDNTVNEKISNNPNSANINKTVDNENQTEFRNCENINDSTTDQFEDKQKVEEINELETMGVLVETNKSDNNPDVEMETKISSEIEETIKTPEIAEVGTKEDHTELPALKSPEISEEPKEIEAEMEEVKKNDTEPEKMEIDEPKELNTEEPKEMETESTEEPKETTTNEIEEPEPEESKETEVKESKEQEPEEESKEQEPEEESKEQEPEEESKEQEPEEESKMVTTEELKELEEPKVSTEEPKEMETEEKEIETEFEPEQEQEISNDEPSMVEKDTFEHTSTEYDNNEAMQDECDSHEDKSEVEDSGSMPNSKYPTDENSEDLADNDEDNEDISKNPVFVPVDEDKDACRDEDDMVNPIEVGEVPDENREDKDESEKEDVDEDEEETPQNPLEITVNEEIAEEDKDDKDDDSVAPIEFEPINETQEGADEELCIIPDTERVLSQAEKEAACSIAPLKDLSEARGTPSTESAESPSMDDLNTTPPENIIISKCNLEEEQTCSTCNLQRKVKFKYTQEMEKYICSDECLEKFKTEHPGQCVLNWECEIRVKDLTAHKEKVSFERKCATCDKKTENDEENLTWQIMDFCGECCLSKYQMKNGATCSNCASQVRSNSLGKYCVRFGNDIRQFCTSHCLEEYKKGLKVCSYCHQDMSGGVDGFLAPVGDKGQFKDFCSKLCMEKYDIMTNNRPPKVPPDTKCAVCKTDNTINIEFELDEKCHYFCSDRCFIAFSFVNDISSGKCSMCRRYFSNDVLEKNTMFYDNVQYSFCSNSCQNIYIIAHRKIVPCVWCKVKKYNFDMIRRYYNSGTVVNMCSLNCLSLFQLSVNAVHSKKTACNYCFKNLQPMYHLTMSDATIRNFCSYGCVIAFQNQYKKQPLDFGNDNPTEETFPVPTGVPKKNKKYSRNDDSSLKTSDVVTIPVISNVQSLANNTTNFITGTRTTRSKTCATKQHLSNTDSPFRIKHHIIIKPAVLPDQRNVATMCKIRSHSRSTMTKTASEMHKSTQTEAPDAKKMLIPVPVPIYVPVPLHMYSVPIPCPLPFPIPIPVPIFVPTTRNSAKGIMKEIKKIQVKIPTDPYEAELLMMAEMVAGDKKEENTDSESDVDDNGGDDGGFSPEPVDASNTFGEDMLQMALKMATELEEPAVDLEGALTANTITAQQTGEAVSEENVDDPAPMHGMLERQSTRGRKRGGRGGKQYGKKRRLSHGGVDMPILPAQPSTAPEHTEKPDAHLCLKYTFGVNAWKQWVTTKNAELEKSSKFCKPFKTEILQLTADELNYSLCLFVKEVRKPNGAEYAPDTIYYLCLGIQQYLFENNRIDNIFCDPYYEQFTDSLDEVARKFSVLYNDSHYIVTRVEEEHLWESKQLGAHSPHVLLSTLMFFNTKHFNLTTVQEHMQLSFSHIMKHWKRNPNQTGVARVPGSRNVLLRFYPPQTAIQSNARKKKVYEQQENEENPLRCPVKLYEFYLSKCPESVKTRNDVFYLQPERSCVPDSPVWYSTTPLCQEALEKMLHRVKMVKEINVALLTS